MKSIYFFSLIILISGFSCSNKKAKEDWITVIGEKSFEGNYEIEFNSDSSYVLINTPIDLPSNSLLHYAIFNYSTKGKVIEEKLNNAEVQWVKTFTILVKVYPEMMSEREEDNIHSYLYNVKRKKKKYLTTTKEQ